MHFGAPRACEVRDTCLGSSRLLRDYQAVLLSGNLCGRFETTPIFRRTVASRAVICVAEGCLKI
ncbi:hypothetical protein SNL152K_4703 [Streptomyces sp. NL15-2K]|nr:hypothetical protein SNL152K_4703 [Streptomyces sp. NL15-2K]